MKRLKELTVLLVILTALMMQAEEFQIKQSYSVGSGDPTEVLEPKYLNLTGDNFVINYILPLIYNYKATIMGYDGTGVY